MENLMFNIVISLIIAVIAFLALFEPEEIKYYRHKYGNGYIVFVVFVFFVVCMVVSVILSTLIAFAFG